MMAKDRDALFCDLAETYGIFDPLSLPMRRLAMYACGLREDARIMMLLSGRRASSAMLLQAAMLDRLSLLVWAKTEDGQKGKNRPVSVFELMNREEEKEQGAGYKDAASFELARNSFFE